MDNKEIYMKDLKRAYDVFQWLQINSDNIKKIYDIITNLDYSNFTSKDEFEELVRETPTIARLVENVGKLQLQLEHDSNVLDIDTDFGHTLLNFILDKSEWQSIYYIEYLTLEGNSYIITIRDCIICSSVEFVEGAGLAQTIQSGNFKFIGLQGYGYDGNTESLPIVFDFENSWCVINAPQGQTIINFADLGVTSCFCTSLISDVVIDV